MTEAPHEPTASVCPQCGTHLAPALLACPSCQRLVHADELKRLAAAAEQATQAGDSSAALAAWREALDLLPRDSTQHQVVSARVLELSRAPDREPQAARRTSRLGTGAAGLGALGALLVKFKFALIFLLTRAKLLLLGPRKAWTFRTMARASGE